MSIVFFLALILAIPVGLYFAASHVVQWVSGRGHLFLLSLIGIYGYGEWSTYGFEYGFTYGEWALIAYGIGIGLWTVRRVMTGAVRPIHFYETAFLLLSAALPLAGHWEVGIGLVVLFWGTLPAATEPTRYEARHGYATVRYMDR